MKKSIIWLRRALRLKDNKVIQAAIQNSDYVKFCFIFDSSILQNFPNKQDRRLSFIVNHLQLLNEELLRHSSSIEILYGRPEEEIPKLALAYSASSVYCDEDLEDSSLKRDEKLLYKLQNLGIEFVTRLDHLLIHPEKITKQDGSPYKVFTPFMKHFRSMINSDLCQPVAYSLEGKILPSSDIASGGRASWSNNDKKEILERAGYEYIEDNLWNPANAYGAFANFVQTKLIYYHENRNLFYGNNTSAISPYLRFGSLSIRECFTKALISEVHPSYVNELIWREFYAYIMHWFPESIELEFQSKYRGQITWNSDVNLLAKFKEAATGFPIVDASIRQLLTTGWMHNRARMIVASFFTKNLFFDWRIGEEFFSQYLMDYDLASNVGGWQWTASTGTDAQPYFRVFSPSSQSKTFDPEGKYIKEFVPELSGVEISDIHEFESIKQKYHWLKYPSPIVDYKKTRQYAIDSFRQVV